MPFSPITVTGKEDYAHCVAQELDDVRPQPTSARGEAPDT